MSSERLGLEEELKKDRQSLKDDPENIELANRYWRNLGRGDYRCGRHVIEAYREAALASSAGGAALASAYRELFLVSGEGPRPVDFDTRLVEALKSYIPDIPEAERTDIRWVLQTIAAI